MGDNVAQLVHRRTRIHGYGYRARLARSEPHQKQLETIGQMKRYRVSVGQPLLKQPVARLVHQLIEFCPREPLANAGIGFGDDCSLIGLARGMEFQKR